MKMQAMETKSQNTIPSAMISNSNVSINKPSDTSMQPQMSNPGQQMPNQLASNQSETRQQLLVQSMRNNALSGGGQVSGSLSSTLPPVTGLNQSPLPTVVRQNTNMGVSQNSMGNTMGQGLNPYLLVNPPRQMQSRQSGPQQKQQQSQNSLQCIYQQQLHHQLMKQKFQQQGNIQQSLVSSHLPQQQLQQNMLQPAQIQLPSKSVLHSSVMQPSSVQLDAIPGPQQNQQTSVQQPAQSMLQHQVMRHRQQPQPQAIHHQQTALSQQPMLISQPLQHHQLTSHQPPQQSQLNGQQNTMGDLQQPQEQQLQSRLLNQQSNLPNFQQQQLLTQQNNLSNVNQHPLAPQSNISGLHHQQQLLGPQLGNSGLQVGPLAVHLLQQPKSQVQQQIQNGGANSLPQGQQSQPTAVQQQLSSQMQQAPAQLQTQVRLQQTVGCPQQANQLQRDVQQRLQAPSASLQQQNAIDQQNQLNQSQRNLTETSSISVDMTSQAGNANAVDWREETYHKLQVMKEGYLPDLTEMLQKIVLKLQQVKALSPQALSAGVNDIGSVVSMVDRIAGSAPGNGPRAAVGEDLVAMNKCRLQAKNFTTQDGAAWSRKMKRFTSAASLSIASSTGSVEDDFLHFIGIESSDSESIATSAVKRPRTEVNRVLLEEIRYINQRLIDTVVDISNEEVDPCAVAAVADGGGVIVKCSYKAISLSPDFQTHYESAAMSRIQALYLLVPTNYPNCSPLLLDQLPGEESKEHGDLSAKTKSRFSISLRNLSQPMSLKEIARTWDKCARGVILEYAQQLGGGSFSSKYGT